MVRNPVRNQYSSKIYFRIQHLKRCPRPHSRIYGILYYYTPLFLHSKDGEMSGTRKHYERHSCIMGQYQRVEIRHSGQSFITTLITSFKSRFLQIWSVSKHTEVGKVYWIFYLFRIYCTHFSGDSISSSKLGNMYLDI